MGVSSKTDLFAGQRYQNVFYIFLLALVFLYRENSSFVYPQILLLLAFLLAFNLAAGWALHRWNEDKRVAVGAVIGNCAAITAIVSYSGGSSSVFWVLYLLPIYTVCLLLNGAHLILIVGGIIGFNALFEGLQTEGFDLSLLFLNLGIKSGLFVFASAATWAIAQRDRKNRVRLFGQKEEISKLEKTIEEQQSHISEYKKMADVEQLASGIAHDLKNPIAVILGTAKMMLEDEHLGAFKADVQRVERASELCSTIVSNVSHLARNTQDGMMSCQMEDVVGAALMIYEPMLNQSRIRVEKEFSPGLPPVMADRVLLERVFLNLISNARGAMKSDGVLTLKIKPSSGPAGLSWIQVVVEDTGPGLPPAVLEKIFKPFNTTKAPGEGTGLGLYLSQQIAQKHGGRIQVENQSEGGARFIVHLPCLSVVSDVANLDLCLRKAA